MNIKELKELIKDLPDDMLVGNSGYFGEYLEVVSTYTSTVNINGFRNRFADNADNDVFKPIFIISTEDPGE